MKSIYILALVALFAACSESSIFWEPVFIGYKGNGQSIHEAWTKQQPAPCTLETAPCTLDRGCISKDVNIATLKPQKKHLKSMLVNDWNKPCFRIQEVRVELLNSGSKRVVAWAEFSGRDTDTKNWFSKDKLLRSSWVDLFSNRSFNYFSIDGHDPRRFFINQNYGGCSVDVGWLMILDGPKHSCKFDKQPTYPAFLYGDKNHKTRYNDGKYGIADILAIYIKRL